MNSQVTNPEQLEHISSFLQALAHPVRLSLVKSLAKGPCCTCELEPALALDQSTISRHLNLLKRAGVLCSCKVGTKVIFQIRDASVLNLLQQASNCVTNALEMELNQQQTQCFTVSD